MDRAALLAEADRISAALPELTRRMAYRSPAVRAAQAVVDAGRRALTRAERRVLDQERRRIDAISAQAAPIVARVKEIEALLAPGQETMSDG